MPWKNRAKDSIENITPTRGSPVIQKPDTDKSRLAGKKKKATKTRTQGFRTITAATADTKGNNPTERGAQQPRPLKSSAHTGCPLRRNTTVYDRKPSAAAANRTQLTLEMNKDLEEAEKEIQKLNELGLGDNISHEEYCDYVEQLPDMPDVDTYTKLNAVQMKGLNTRHALYRIKYYQLSQNVPEEELSYDRLKEKYPLRDLEMNNFFKYYEEDGKFDWFFHPDYCKLDALEDYQRLVPRNNCFEYAKWDEYRKNFRTYEIEQEYVNYCEELSKKLKWIEVYVQDRPSSLKWGRILTRGNYQAIKIATGFSKITGGLAFSGFYEYLSSMTFDVNYYNEFDGVYYEIWQRHTKEKKFRDALEEVYELNRFPLRQNRMRCALDNDTFCSNFKEEFLACTACLEEDKAQVTEVQARQLIARALRKETRKPKFYEDYCRKKIDIARAIGLISIASS